VTARRCGRAAARRRRNHWPHLAVAADQKRQSGLSNLSLEIEVDITSNLRTRLLAQEIDLAFVVGPLSVSTVATGCSATIGRFSGQPSLGLARKKLNVRDLAKFRSSPFTQDPAYEVVRSLFKPA